MSIVVSLVFLSVAWSTDADGECFMNGHFDYLEKVSDTIVIASL